MAGRESSATSSSTSATVPSGAEEDIAGAAVDDALDLVEGLAVLAFFGEALDGGAPGLGLDGLIAAAGKS